jgi:hypothetical protein
MKMSFTAVEEDNRKTVLEVMNNFYTLIFFCGGGGRLKCERREKKLHSNSVSVLWNFKQ